MSKEERFEAEHGEWIIDNNKRDTGESLIVYDTECNTLDDLCNLLNQQDQRIAELEEQLANSIRPKFDRQEHICSFAFGEIREHIVVAYLDNNITLCENIETSELEWCDNNFLVRTFEEAQAKLKELQSNDNKEKLWKLITNKEIKTYKSL